MADTRDATVAYRRARGEATPAEDEAAPTEVSGAHTAPRPLYTEHPSRSTGAGTTTLTPLETLRMDEVLRARRFLVVAMILIVSVVGVLRFLGGDPFLKNVMSAACGLTFVTFAAFYWLIRDASRYTPGRALFCAVVAIVAATSAVHYFGLYSPAPMIFMLGIYFFSLGSSLWAALVAYGMCAGLQATGMLAIAFGLMVDRGLLPSASLPTEQRLIITGIVQAVFAATFLFARLSRKATLAAIAGLEQALRQVGQREALLQEANQNLERALRGGYRGRWSGERVGPWRCAEVIGRGAMGEVYAANHEERALEAALKLLHSDVATDADRMRRFLREAEIMSQLDSPHVVKVFDFGDGLGGPPYIAMELLRGHDLGWYLRKKRRLPVRRVVEMVGQISSALEKARSAEIVHRDLKPTNLFLAELGSRGRLWKVLDFGVSKLGNVAGTLTQGQVIGTPGYMAPEQARGGTVDHRADVFALAAIAYRALTGRPPFAGDDYPKVMFDTVYTQPTRPSALVRMPRDVELVLLLGLAKRSEDRPNRAIEFAAALALASEDRLPDGDRQRAYELMAKQPWSE